VAAPKPAHVTVARILRPQGRRGEVAAEILTDFPDHLKKLESAFLWDGVSDPRRISVRGCWLSQSRGGQAILHFEGSDSISDAEKLVGLEVQIAFGERAPLPPGSYYISDLVGCEIVDRSGRVLGAVSDVQFTGEEVAGTPILVVDSPKGELLIPLAEEICVRVDTASRRIDAVLPEGLLELNEA